MPLEGNYGSGNLRPNVAPRAVDPVVDPRVAAAELKEKLLRSKSQRCSRDNTATPEMSRAFPDAPPSGFVPHPLPQKPLQVRVPADPDDIQELITACSSASGGYPTGSFHNTVESDISTHAKSGSHHGHEFSQSQRIPGLEHTISHIGKRASPFSPSGTSSRSKNREGVKANSQDTVRDINYLPADIMVPIPGLQLAGVGNPDGQTSSANKTGTEVTTDLPKASEGSDLDRLLKLLEPYPEVRDWLTYTEYWDIEKRKKKLSSYRKHAEIKRIDEQQALLAAQRQKLLENDDLDIEYTPSLPQIRLSTPTSSQHLLTQPPTIQTSTNFTSDTMGDTPIEKSATESTLSILNQPLSGADATPKPTSEPASKPTPKPTPKRGRDNTEVGTEYPAEKMRKLQTDSNSRAPQPDQRIQTGTAEDHGRDKDQDNRGPSRNSQSRDRDFVNRDSFRRRSPVLSRRSIKREDDEGEDDRPMPRYENYRYDTYRGTGRRARGYWHGNSPPRGNLGRHQFVDPRPVDLGGKGGQYRHSPLRTLHPISRGPVARYYFCFHKDLFMDMRDQRLALLRKRIS